MSAAGDRSGVVRVQNAVTGGEAGGGRDGWGPLGSTQCRTPTQGRSAALEDPAPPPELASRAEPAPQLLANTVPHHILPPTLCTRPPGACPSSTVRAQLASSWHQDWAQAGREGKETKGEFGMFPWNKTVLAVLCNFSRLHCPHLELVATEV